MVLDFEDFQTIEKSVLDIMDINHYTLDELFGNWEFDNYSYADTQFYNYIRHNNLIKNNIEKVSWFHLSRTWTGKDTFQKGIQPLGQAINEIWSNIRIIWPSVNNKEFYNFKEKYIFESLRYKNKIRHKINHGPYAMLIKDISKNLIEEGNHDYLSIPEIVEDILDEINDRYNINLKPDYQLKTRPTIVKFYHSENTEQYIGNALYYLYEKFKKTGNELKANTCFNANGKSISPEYIDYIEIH